jgi:hypothetical protein
MPSSPRYLLLHHERQLFGVEARRQNRQQRLAWAGPSGVRQAIAELASLVWTGALLTSVAAVVERVSNRRRTKRDRPIEMI